MKKIIAVTLILVVILLAGCAAKTDRQMIEDRIKTYISCCNNMNMDGALDCMDTKTRNAVNSMINMAGNLFGSYLGGFDLRDLMNVGSLFASSDMYNMTLDSIDDIQINGDNATATVTLSATANGNTESGQTSIPMVKENGDWFLTMGNSGLGGLGSLFG